MEQGGVELRVIAQPIANPDRAAKETARRSDIRAGYHTDCERYVPDRLRQQRTQMFTINGLPAPFAERMSVASYVDSEYQKPDKEEGGRNPDE
jgi:hypothetical protein